MARPTLPPEQRQANTPCKVDGCSTLRAGKGYCRKHLRRFNQFGDPHTTKSHPNSGVSKLPEYWVLQSMKVRCYLPSDKCYQDYGGRGIRVCDRWLESGGKGVDNFIEDMGSRPSSKHTIERIDNNGDYTPSNCRWATAQEQANNRRTNVFITAFGKTQTEMQWSRETGIRRETIRRRRLLGWTGEKLFLPVGSTR